MVCTNKDELQREHNNYETETKDTVYRGVQRVKTQDGLGVLAINIIIFCHLQTEKQLVEKQNDCTYYALVAPGSFSELLDHFRGTMLFIRHSTFSLAAISKTSSNTFIDVY